MKTFEELLGKDSALLKAIKKKGFKEPSPIQEQSIPIILKGKDVIAGASTGSGKTLAFASGLINNIDKKGKIQGLVLTPTRELAEQITSELLFFSKEKNLEIISVYGGVSIENQISKLKNTDIVVGTPGRVLDHIDRKSIDLSNVNTLVLDEADRMLDMGFIDDVDKIIAEIPNKRQTLLFSATISYEIHEYTKKYLKHPVEISTEQHVDPKKLEQVYFDVQDGLKYSLLKQFLEQEKKGLVMVFCNSRKNVDFLYNNLKFNDIKTLPLHGGFSQDKRNKMIESFHSKEVRILIATDVAARGLDIKGVSHVYNYDIPPTKKEYIHRIGRTARAGKEGKVINIVASRDYDNFHNVIKEGDITVKREHTPYVKRTRIRWMPENKDQRQRRHHLENKGQWKSKSGSNRDYKSKDRDSRGGSRGGLRQRSSPRDNRWNNSRSGQGGRRDNRRDSREGSRGRDSRGGSRGNYGNRDNRRDSRPGSRDRSRGNYGNRDNRRDSRPRQGGRRDNRRDSRDRGNRRGRR